MAHLADYDTRKQYLATVKKTKRLTPEDSEEVRELVLEVEDKGFECKVDESFGVLLDVADDFGNNRHHRLYSVADVPSTSRGKTSITMLVKRCNYVDDFSGELQYGLASNFLCDRKVGDQLRITGPFPLAFSLPREKVANLILIGMGTGIAPFRAFIKHLYRHDSDFAGRVMLFYGARSGLELMYLNEEDGDLTNYYDKETFDAFHALSPSPLWHDDVFLDYVIEDRAEEVLELLQRTNTYVYIAGHEKVKGNLDKVFSKIMGSEEKWKARKVGLMQEKKWVELIY